MSFNTKHNNTKSNNANKSNNSNIVKKPYCKVCHDAGKEESIYTSHYVKSDPGPKGKVVCPTLLEQLCKCCLKQGHTISYCPEVKKQNKMEKKENYHKESLPKIIPIPVLKRNNRFDLLDLDGYDEVLNKKKNKNKNNKNEVIKEDDFPELTSSTKKSTATTNTNSWNNLSSLSYASIAKNAHEEAVKEEIMIEIYKPKEEIKKPIILIKKRKPIQISKPIKKNWADYDSDDDEDEEDEDDNGDEYDYEEYELKKSLEIEEEGFQSYEY